MNYLLKYTRDSQAQNSTGQIFLHIKTLPDKQYTVRDEFRALPASRITVCIYYTSTV